RGRRGAVMTESTNGVGTGPTGPTGTERSGTVTSMVPNTVPDTLAEPVPGWIDPSKADLVLEGGGVRGIGLLGAIVGMAEAGLSFPRIAGASAGAIVGALTAAHQAAGRPVADLVPVMESLEYERFKDGALLTRFGLLGKAVELMMSDGIYRGDF